MRAVSLVLELPRGFFIVCRFAGENLPGRAIFLGAVYKEEFFRGLLF